jgi:hypothetical protein
LREGVRKLEFENRRFRKAVSDLNLHKLILTEVLIFTKDLGSHSNAFRRAENTKWKITLRGDVDG